MATTNIDPNPMSPDPDHWIRIRGARVHNLQDVDLDLPRDRLVVMTGVSGSGKSSLAFDTLYAEGQRRYLDSLSTYARQFVDQRERPDVDLIEGLPPTVAIDQHASAAGPRSTVGTITEILDYLRLLYARVGRPHCPSCGTPIDRQTPDQIIEGALRLGEGRRVIVLAPMVRARKGLHREAFEAIRKAGLIRARVDGTVVELEAEEDPKLARSKVHTIEAVVDRLAIREGVRSRLAESVDLALKLGDEAIVLSVEAEDRSWTDRVLSSKLACPDCGAGFDELEPRTLSFNSPHGACPTCEGLGTVRQFDDDLLIPDRTLSIDRNALAPLSDPSLEATSKPRRRAGKPLRPAIQGYLEEHGLDTSTTLSEWSLEDVDGLLEALKGRLTEALKQAKGERQRQAVEAYRSEVTCPDCSGARLGPLGRAVEVSGASLPTASTWSLTQLVTWLDGLSFDGLAAEVGPRIIVEVLRRLRFLGEVGLGYLSLDRRAGSLSGGELQRVRLATQVGSGLTGVAYLLDEPTAGLHPRDTQRLLAILGRLRDRGNSILVVEHDDETIRAADWIVDVGPGAGPRGGRIVAQGRLDAIADSVESITGRYLDAGRSVGTAQARTNSERRRADSPGWLVVEGAAEHNLQGIDVRIPLGALTCVTGVSGSGKSTLVMEILAPALQRELSGSGSPPGKYQRIDHGGQLDKIITIDQSPIGRNPRSTPATYTGLMAEIRQAFAATKEAKIRGYKAGRFSFNGKEGQCPACQGQGQVRVVMQFLPDDFVACTSCDGLRYAHSTLQVRYHGRSIGEVLQMEIGEARELFGAIPKLARGLDALIDAGLEYLQLGQSSLTLSGGEAQRVKLATELSRPRTGRTLLILDEPTTGLHYADVERLTGVLTSLADQGNTVLVIEHNLDLIRRADWVVDLGPEAGDQGGRLVAQGPPETIAEIPESRTGRFLQRVACTPSSSGQGARAAN